MAPRNGNGFVWRTTLFSPRPKAYLVLPDGALRFIGPSESPHLGTIAAPSANHQTIRKARGRAIDSVMLPGGILIDLVRDPDPWGGKLKLIVWRRNVASVHDDFEWAGELLIPPHVPASLLRAVRFPNRIEPCGNPRQIHAELTREISCLVKIEEHQARLVAYFVMASWFPELLPVAPYLIIYGSAKNAKRPLLRVISALTRRSLVVADISSAALYRLQDAIHPTLLIDEFTLHNGELSRKKLNLLRAGLTPGERVARSEGVYDAYGPKVICAHLAALDCGILSQSLQVNMLLGDKEAGKVDERMLNVLADKMLPKL